jgi:glycosyltransferase involved in cell wall biosynthesis
MLSVCHIVSGDLWAGAEVLTFNLLRQLNKIPDLTISAVVLNEGRLAEELRRQGVTIRVIGERGQPFVKLLREVRAYIRSRSPEVIHSHRYKENILAFFSRKLGRPARLVATQHGMPETGHGNSGAASRLVGRLNRYLLANQFDQLVGVSFDIQKRFIQELGFREEQVSVIHNGIELPELRSFKRSGPMVVGSAGRLFAVKDFPLMIAAARIAVNRKAGLRFEIAGEGPERAHLEELIAACGVGDHFALLGHVADMQRFYSGLDVYMNTSIHEGIPMSILEAMAHGVPVIAPHVGGIVEIIDDGVDGFLVSGRKPQDFAERCIRLQDLELRKRMGQAARDKVKRLFSAEQMAHQYHRLYHELAS